MYREWRMQEKDLMERCKFRGREESLCMNILGKKVPWKIREVSYRVDLGVQGWRSTLALVTPDRHKRDNLMV